MYLKASYYSFIIIIHSHLIISSRFILFYRVAGKLEPIPADYGRKAGYTLDKSPGHHRADT